MSKNIFKEKQQFRNWEVLALLGFFIVALTYRFVEQNFINPIEAAMPFSTYFILMLPLAAGLWYLLSLRMSVRITDKHISLKYSPLHERKQKIKWDNVESCELVETSVNAQFSGFNISYDHEKMYSLNGRTGLHLKTRKGEDIIIGVKNMSGLRKAVNQIFPSPAMG